MRLYKVYTRELGIYPVKLYWNLLFGSKEARFKEPEADIKNLYELCGPFTDIFKHPNDLLGE